jgi:chloramphenicol 3-O-phosphotransferase
MSRVIRCSSADVRSIFEGWVAGESAAGARLIVLEGAMMSGKSCLAKQPLTLGSRQSVNIEVDGLARQTVNQGYIRRCASRRP